MAALAVSSLSAQVDAVEPVHSCHAYAKVPRVSASARSLVAVSCWSSVGVVSLIVTEPVVASLTPATAVVMPEHTLSAVPWPSVKLMQALRPLPYWLSSEVKVAVLAVSSLSAQVAVSATSVHSCQA